MNFEIKINIKENFNERFSLDIDQQTIYTLNKETDNNNLTFSKKTPSTETIKTSEFIQNYFNNINAAIELIEKEKETVNNTAIIKFNETVKLNEIELRPNDYLLTLTVKLNLNNQIYDTTIQFTEAYLIEMLTNDLTVIYLLLKKSITNGDQEYKAFIKEMYQKGNTNILLLNNFQGLKKTLFQNVSKESLLYFPYSTPTKPENIIMTLILKD